MAATIDTSTSATPAVVGVPGAVSGAMKVAVHDAVITGVTNTIQKYNYEVDNYITTTIEGGTGYLLNKIGMATDDIPIVGGILQDVANAGITSATGLVEHIISGNLSLSNIGIFNDPNNNDILGQSGEPNGLIASGVNKLAGALGLWQLHSSNENAGESTGGVNEVAALSSITSTAFNDRGYGGSYASVYADEYAPKLLYMFEVTITVRGGNGEGAAIEGAPSETHFSFLIHKFQRPLITTESTDVNFYGFYAPIITRVIYGPLTLNIQDDKKSEALDWVIKYFKSISPILTNRSTNTGDMASGMMEPIDSRSSASSYGIRALTDVYGVMSSIVVRHFYDNNTLMDRYTFVNPHITEVTLNELDMSSSDPADIQVTFAYERLGVEVGIQAASANTIRDTPTAKRNAPLSKFNNNDSVTNRAYKPMTNPASNAIPRVVMHPEHQIAFGDAVATFLKSNFTTPAISNEVNAIAQLAREGVTQVQSTILRAQAGEVRLNGDILTTDSVASQIANIPAQTSPNAPYYVNNHNNPKITTTSPVETLAEKIIREANVNINPNGKILDVASTDSLQQPKDAATLQAEAVEATALSTADQLRYNSTFQKNLENVIHSNKQRKGSATYGLYDPNRAQRLRNEAAKMTNQEFFGTASSSFSFTKRLPDGKIPGN